jgi:NDP-sugar pyrophosphorylase family protein
VSDKTDLGKEFIVCNGDYVIIRKLEDGKLCLQMDLDDILDYHRKARQSIGTVVTDTLFPVAREDGGRFGVAELKNVEGFNVITKFVEKPDVKTIPPSVKELPVNAGVYVMDRNFIFTNINELLPDKPKTKLEKTVLERLATDTEKNMKRPKLAAYILKLFGWFDVGTLEQLIDVSMYVANKKGGYIPPPTKINSENKG